ncbi:MAG: hypothetical protein EON91_12785 [Brevundimonas sp.]|uniref:hypothetical protein n=1 Tax=Brevundimonas sp. TaxID=1871086 RepID=UPI001219D2C5|nr:hypothetical protein [Brevundimonas sp.]RZJ16548.1 MAG: hypothetical protein EON91_12785 [Brevundimonas sp.]
MYTHPKIIAAAAAAAAVALVIASPAPAQDFLGGLARGAARQAAQALADRATQAVTQPRQPAATPARPAPAPTPSSGAPRAPQTSAGAAPASSTAPLPIPTNLSPALRSPGEFEFSQADQTAKKAFVDFGKVSCSSCEGGYSFDTWAQHQIPGMFGKLGDHLWGLSVGESLRWTGTGGGGAYAITIASEHPVNGFPCKQLDYTGRKGAQSAGYRGLICRSGNGGSVLF